MNPAADKVRSERLRRKWSVRRAATAAGISNTYWSNFENGAQPLTPALVDAIARAFEWPEDWAEVTGDLVDAELLNAVRDLVADVAALVSRFDRLDERVGRLERRPRGAARVSR